MHFIVFKSHSQFKAVVTSYQRHHYDGGHSAAGRDHEALHGPCDPQEGCNDVGAQAQVRGGLHHGPGLALRSYHRRDAEGREVLHSDQLKLYATGANRENTQQYS